MGGGKGVRVREGRGYRRGWCASLCARDFVTRIGRSVCCLITILHGEGIWVIWPQLPEDRVGAGNGHRDPRQARGGAHDFWSWPSKERGWSWRHGTTGPVTPVKEKERGDTGPPEDQNQEWVGRQSLIWPVVGFSVFLSFFYFVSVLTLSFEFRFPQIHAQEKEILIWDAILYIYILLIFYFYLSNTFNHATHILFSLRKKNLLKFIWKSFPLFYFLFIYFIIFLYTNFGLYKTYPP